MATLEEITERMQQAVAGGGGLDKTVKFDLGADGVVFLDGSTVTNEDKAADCTLQLSKADFEAMGRKELDPTMAYMSGRLKIQGDMGVAMKLQPILSRVG